jgi:hypothetical protein
MDQDGRTYESDSVPNLSDGLESAVSQPWEWFFLIGYRLIISAVLLVGVFAVLTAVESISGFRSEQMQPLFYPCSALTGGSFTLITIVHQ